MTPRRPTTNNPSAPLSSPDERARRLALLDAPHVAPLEQLSNRARANGLSVPHVDPLDGGVRARVLLLLESPGPRMPEPRFVSRDNPTGTARNITRFFAQAGIDRTETLIWNAVPFVIHAPGARNRAPRKDEIATGLAMLPPVLAALPDLVVVVAAGRVAAGAKPVAAGAGAAFVAIAHPSPIYVNTSPAIARSIADRLTDVAAMLRS